MKSLIGDLFGKSPFGPIVEHSKKVHECVELLWPLLEALIQEDYDTIHRLHSKMSRLEHEADLIKHDIRSFISQRYFLPVDRSDLVNFLARQEKIADLAEDFAVVLTLRRTTVHVEIQDLFLCYLNQVFQVSGTLLTAAVEFKNLAETAFGGAEARSILKLIENLGEEEWKTDKMSRKLSRAIYSLEGREDILNILFYEKMVIMLGSIANQAENAGDYLRVMIEKR
ncbi:TIGR00153 family protein [Desulfolithobacter dissulfuricans]|uniref:TIGR00153 family protein n=1 Tax=Desulfolithobacter dissulfuricans TaxID=2795293 RepID=A0A915XJ30_9BACT|nr:TIGR00153 family protein [Desulfolithobacter dissulfuricans]BCO08247.1 TIGR00153 family protein [Desulfolithobacter dissulfuricans]